MKKMYFLAFFALFLMSAPTKVWGAYTYKTAPTHITIETISSSNPYKYKLTISQKGKNLGESGTTLYSSIAYVFLQSSTQELEGTYSLDNNNKKLISGETTSSTYVYYESNPRYLLTTDGSKKSNFVISKIADGVYKLETCTLYTRRNGYDYFYNYCYDANTLTNSSEVEPFLFVNSNPGRTYLMKKEISNVEVQYDAANNQTQLTFGIVGARDGNYNYTTTLKLNNSAFLAGTYTVGASSLDAMSKMVWVQSESSSTTRYPLSAGTRLSIEHVSGSDYKLSGALCAKQNGIVENYFYNFGAIGIPFSCRLKYETSDTEDKTAFLSQIKESGADFDLTLSRSLSAANYNTFCSPVTIPAGEIETLLGEDAEVYAFASVSGDAESGYTFTFMPLEGDIEAGVPYLVKPSSDIAQIELTNVATSRLTTTPQTVTHNGFSFCGVLAPTDLSGGEYILGNGDLLYKALPGQMKGMRAYFTIPAPAGVTPRVSMNILNQTDTPTNWQAVHSVPKIQKMLRNGRLLIHRDGKTYDILGNKQ